MESNPIANNDGSTSNTPSGSELNTAYYEEDIKPLMIKSCMPCHGPGNAKNWLSYKTTLDHAPAILASVKHAPGFLPMPMGSSKLPQSDVQIIQKWIDSGTQEKAPKTDTGPVAKEPGLPPVEEIKEDINSVASIYKNNCASCHNNTAVYPILNGQNKNYLYSQLKAFSEGERTNPIMNLIAKQFFADDQVANDMAEYISSLSPCELSVQEKAQTTAVFDKHSPNLEQGKAIYETQCASCHSNHFAFPKLEGLNGSYLTKTLNEFQSQERPATMMGSITSALSSQDMLDLAKYIDSLDGCVQ